MSYIGPGRAARPGRGGRVPAHLDGVDELQNVWIDNLNKLNTWMKEVRNSGIYNMQRSVRSLQQDIHAVRNAIIEYRSNGQLEGQTGVSRF
jgi:transposase